MHKVINCAAISQEMNRNKVMKLEYKLYNKNRVISVRYTVVAPFVLF